MSSSSPPTSPLQVFHWTSNHQNRKTGYIRPLPSSLDISASNPTASNPTASNPRTVFLDAHKLIAPDSHSNHEHNSHFSASSSSSSSSSLHPRFSEKWWMEKILPSMDILIANYYIASNDRSMLPSNWTQLEQRALVSKVLLLNMKCSNVYGENNKRVLRYLERLNSIPYGGIEVDQWVKDNAEKSHHEFNINQKQIVILDYAAGQNLDQKQAEFQSIVQAWGKDSLRSVNVVEGKGIQEDTFSFWSIVMRFTHTQQLKPVGILYTRSLPDVLKKIQTDILCVMGKQAIDVSHLGNILAESNTKMLFIGPDFQSHTYFQGTSPYISGEKILQLHAVTHLYLIVDEKSNVKAILNTIHAHRAHLQHLALVIQRGSVEIMNHCIYVIGLCEQLTSLWFSPGLHPGHIYIDFSRPYTQKDQAFYTKNIPRNMNAWAKLSRLTFARLDYRIANAIFTVPVPYPNQHAVFPKLQSLQVYAFGQRSDPETGNPISSKTGAPISALSHHDQPIFHHAMSYPNGKIWNKVFPKISSLIVVSDLKWEPKVGWFWGGQTDGFTGWNSLCSVVYQEAKVGAIEVSDEMVMDLKELFYHQSKNQSEDRFGVYKPQRNYTFS